MNSNSRITPHIPKVGRIMITDHGTHPPEFWAQVSAEQICPISDNVTGARRIAALKLQAEIAVALEAHHTSLHEEEHAALAADSTYHLEEVHPDNCVDLADKALADIQAAAVGTEWQEHFNFVMEEPDWLEDYLAKVEEVGEAHIDQAVKDGLITPLTPAQQDTKTRFDRYLLIHQEVARMFASHQHVERSHYRDQINKEGK